MKLRAAVVVAVIAWTGSAGAAEKYVSKGGDDAHDGSAGSPFATIQKCAEVMGPADTCHIDAGRYAGRVKPAHSGASGSPIRFVATKPGSVILSGRTAVTGWTKHTGSIWKAHVDFASDALFVDGAPMVIARFPNLESGDAYRPTFLETGSDGGTTWMVDSTHLTQPAGYWDGAKLFIVAGLGWSADDVTVTKWDAATHRIDFSPELAFHCCYTADKESRYYLYDKLELLDAPGEWYLDSASQTLYLWPPDGKDPSAHLVEATTADAGFDVSKLSDVEVEGITIESGTVDMTDSTRCKLDSVRVLYGQTPGSAFSGGGQVVVSGSDNEIVHSEIAYAPGRCVDLGGTHNALRSSHVHHCDALGTYAQIVKIAGKENVIADCSLHDTGRDGVGTGAGLDGSVVEHNEIFNTGLIGKDCGAFYTYETDGGDTVLRYNVVHGVHPAKTEAYGGIQLGMGIYFDDGCSNYIAHHNVVYDISHDGLFLHQPSKHIRVYNNTVVASGGGWSDALATAPGNEGPDATGSLFTNNLGVLLDDRDGWCLGIDGAIPPYDHNGYWQKSGKGQTNQRGVEASGVVADPRFVDASKNQFALLAGSPMIDKGVAVPGITDGFVGAAPDIGAFEQGGSEFPGPRGAVGPTMPPAEGDGGVAMDGGDGDAGPISSGDDASTPSDGAAPSATPGGDVQGSCGCRLAGGRRETPTGSIALLVVAGLVIARRHGRTTERTLRNVGSRTERRRKKLDSAGSNS